MRNNTRKLSIAVEDDAVRTGRATIVDGSAAQDRELVVGAVNGEIEALVVVVHVGVGVVIFSLGLKVVAGVQGGGHGAAAVAVGSAGVLAGTRSEFLEGDGKGAGHEDSGEGEDLNV